MNVRIVAIAKDESAYLADWIFHHMYFGFNSIEIYVNRTKDNSYELLNNISKNSKVNVINADSIVEKSGANFQNQAYSDGYNKAKKEGVDYLLFLDIDEFWVPTDFNSKIQNYLAEYNNPDVMSFEWVFPCSDLKTFSRPFNKDNFVSKDTHVKTIFKVGLDVKSVHAHNVNIPGAEYYLADGSKFEGDNLNKYRVSQDINYETLKPAVILHRVSRSKIEYISMLGKGRPSSNNKIKNNRWGYVHSTNSKLNIRIDEPLLLKYNTDYLDFITLNNLSNEIEIGKEFVLNRYIDVLKIIISLQPDEFNDIQHLFPRIDLISLKAAINYVFINENQFFVDLRELDLSKCTNLLNDYAKLTKIELQDVLIQNYLLLGLNKKSIDNLITELVSIDFSELNLIKS